MSSSGEYSGGAALAIDGKLLGEVGGAVGVGHGACREQEQLAEVARIQRQAGNLSTGKVLTPTGLGRGFFAGGQKPQFRRLGKDLQAGGEHLRLVRRGCAACRYSCSFNREVVVGRAIPVNAKLHWLSRGCIR